MRNFILLFCLLCIQQGFAQDYTVEDVMRLRLRNIGPIIQENQVKGYYAFYQVARADRGNRIFMLKILDENAQEVASSSLVKSKFTYLTEGVYNGKAILFSFIDTRERTAELVTYDLSAQQIGSLRYPRMRGNVWRATYGYSMIEGEESSNLTIYPAGESGFIRQSFVDTRKTGYKLEFLPNDLGESGRWEKSSDPQSREFEVPEIADVHAPFLISGIALRRNSSSRDIHYNLQLRDIYSGEALFEQPLYDKQYKLSFLMGKFHPKRNEIMVVGEYFRPQDKVFNGKSLGLYIMGLDLEGNINRKVFLSWQEDISKFLSVNEKGRLDEGGFLAFHRAVLDRDGELYFVAERYRKAVSGTGVALNILSAAAGSESSGIAYLKMVVEEMLVFDLSEDLTLEEVKIFEKRPNSILLPEGWGWFSSKALAQYMASFGWFDYNYTQEAPDDKSFYATFISMDKEKKEGRKPYMGVIIKDPEGEFSLDKVDLRTDARRINVLPASPGKVMILEYYKRERRLSMRLEEFNY
ncbi:MAG: DUF6770 family protein [Bacteroidota bacterium]